MTEPTRPEDRDASTPSTEASTERPPWSGSTRRTVLKGAAGAGLAAMAAMSGIAAPTRRDRRSARARALFEDPPNFVVVMMDDAPSDCFNPAFNCFNSITGADAPNWLSYVNSIVNDPLCAPARASVLTGLISQHHNVVNNDVGKRTPYGATWFTALKEAGYVNGGFGKLMNHYGTLEYDEDRYTLIHSTEYMEKGFNKKHDEFRMLVSEPGYLDYTLLSYYVDANGTRIGDPAGMNALRDYGCSNPETDEATRDTDYLTDVSRFHILDFIDRVVPLSRPFAVYWAPNAPHKDGGKDSGPLPAWRHRNALTLQDMYDNPSPTFNAKTDNQADLPWLQSLRPPGGWMSPGQKDCVLTEKMLGLRAMKAVDEALAAIVDKLDSLGILDKTVIMVLTDNGHMYGTFQMTDKGTSFEDALNMRLRVRFPNYGGVRNQVVSNVDLANFVCELAGATDFMALNDGLSFLPTIASATAVHRRETLFCHAVDKPGTPAFDGLRIYSELPGDQINRKIVRARCTGKPANSDPKLDKRYVAEGQAWAHDLANDPYEKHSLTPTAAEIQQIEDAVFAATGKWPDETIAPSNKTVAEVPECSTGPVKCPRR
jgi:arylsulfatase A-like enzyme